MRLPSVLLRLLLVGAILLSVVSLAEVTAAAAGPSSAFCRALHAASADIAKLAPSPVKKGPDHQALSKIQNSEAFHMNAASTLAPTPQAATALLKTARYLSAAAKINAAAGTLTKVQSKDAAQLSHEAAIAFLGFTTIHAATGWCGGY
jgi:hypothetical protein